MISKSIDELAVDLAYAREDLAVVTELARDWALIPYKNRAQRIKYEELRSDAKRKQLIVNELVDAHSAASQAT